MCVIYLAFRSTSGYRLIVAANRDEFHARPTAPLHAWPEDPRILAGRDLRAGGTWMGIQTDGRFAALTNFREPAAVVSANVPSRGALVSSYLTEGRDPALWLEGIAARAAAWPGFSLFASDLDTLAHYSNRSGEVQTLAPGRYAISNGLLGDPWPKVVRGLERFESALEGHDGKDLAGVLLEVLSDATPADEASLPDTGVGADGERMLSPIFIPGTDYGTRSSSVIAIGEDGSGEFLEQSWGPDGVAMARVRERFRVSGGPAPAGSSSRESR